MLRSEIFDAVHAVVGPIWFQQPLTVEDMATIRDALRPRLPGELVEVYHRLVDVVVQVHDSSGALLFRSVTPAR
jgi:hypothetical protein